MKHDHGVVVYDIHPNGCLNGVGSDTYCKAQNRIYNEILRKKSVEDNGELEGNYIFAYIDVYDEIICGTAIIKEENGCYAIEFLDDKGSVVYEGTGWKTKENQLTVSYRYLEQTCERI